MIIRKIREHDAENFLSLCKQLDEETQFMMLEPGERSITIKQQREDIKNILSTYNQTIIVIESNKQLGGYIAGIGGNYQRNKHTCHIVIGILKSLCGKGLGRKLFIELEKWAYSKNIYRLELTVMMHNKKAIALYKKMGFKIEGIRRKSLLVNNVYIDEYYMAKLLY
ncbi:Protein N-acetyltransferase, RimJ/RimL family [Desulfonauticus submarinus]|uniref:Protein N-acetyltransferase, RimJ/RimL family n=1 Tax=Desulfonauticus submarinus TaxID=206665 RepID=A0A1H0B312_9BACT|nr:GNAT family protein [Desulfonauticus submarinus]SDN40037.1 Protein N-acetyltransferase, RimJ/RimL family [Desulfonauticus submarinus]